MEIKKKTEGDRTKTQNEGGSKHYGDNDGENDGDDDDNENDNGDDDNDEADAAGKREIEDISKEELALRIYNTITSNILPQLQKCVTKKVSL